MRFMVIIKSDPKTEDTMAPTEEMLSAMGKYNEELVNAGIMLSGEGLHPSSKGARVQFSPGGKTSVIDGPFTEAKELIAGFWIWKCDSLEQAIEWVRRCPNPDDVESTIEIRQVFEDDDFGDAFTPELREQEQRLRDKIESQQK